MSEGLAGERTEEAEGRTGAAGVEARRGVDDGGTAEGRGSARPIKIMAQAA